MSWVDLRLDIGTIFAELVPTQWSALSGAFRYKHPQYWDDRGDVYNRRTPSTAYQWQADILLARLNAANKKWERDIRRRRRMRVSTHCRGCNRPLDHTGRVNIRVYCDPRCQTLADRRRADAIKRETVVRCCVICDTAFSVDKYRAKKLCGANPCTREARRRYYRKKRSA